MIVASVKENSISNQLGLFQRRILILQLLGALCHLRTVLQLLMIDALLNIDLQPDENHKEDHNWNVHNDAG